MCGPDTNSITLLLTKSPVNYIRFTNLFTSEHFRESKLDWTKHVYKITIYNVIRIAM